MDSRVDRPSSVLTRNAAQQLEVDDKLVGNAQMHAEMHVRTDGHTHTHARTHARTHAHTHQFNGPLSGCPGLPG